jgi:hypothetical protein
MKLAVAFIRSDSSIPCGASNQKASIVNLVIRSRAGTSNHITPFHSTDCLTTVNSSTTRKALTLNPGLYWNLFGREQIAQCCSRRVLIPTLVVRRHYTSHRVTDMSRSSRNCSRWVLISTLTIKAAGELSVRSPLQVAARERERVDRLTVAQTWRRYQICGAEELDYIWLQRDNTTGWPGSLSRISMSVIVLRKWL